jgi:cell division septum initiation protein DivIVA
MAANDTNAKPANRNSPRSSEDLSDEIDAIRTEIQNLTSTVTKVAGSQINHAQESVESAIKGNPFAAVAIAAAPASWLMRHPGRNHQSQVLKALEI